MNCIFKLAIGCFDNVHCKKIGSLLFQRKVCSPKIHSWLNEIHIVFTILHNCKFYAYSPEMEAD